MLIQDVQPPGSAALHGLVSRQPLPASQVATSFDDLRPAEAQRVESGAWFSSLSLTLRQAVLSRSRVHRVRRGATLLKRGSVATDWIGVAGGALGLATQGRDGRGFMLDLLAPGDWYGDIALVDGGAVDLDIVAQTHSTVLLVDRSALQQLIHSQPELRAALLQLDCRRLRHMFRRLEELQTLALSQRVALQLQRLLRQFGRPGDKPSAGWQIDLTLTQGDLASLLGASRQRINGVLRQLQAEGILGSSHGRIEVLQPRQLVDVAQGRRLLDTAGV
jgi:CRP-like cAMP-binding protein